MTPHPPQFSSTSGTISYMLLQVKSDTVSVRELMQMMGEQGLLVLCALMTLPFIFPVSIPGVSTVFGAAILLIGFAKDFIKGSRLVAGNDEINLLVFG